MKRLVIAVFAVLVCGPARGAAPGDFSGLDARLGACLARHGDTPGVGDCWSVARVAADRRLNAAYAGLAEIITL